MAWAVVLVVVLVPLVPREMLRAVTALGPVPRSVTAGPFTCGLLIGWGRWRLPS